MDEKKGLRGMYIAEGLNQLLAYHAEELTEPTRVHLIISLRMILQDMVEEIDKMELSVPELASKEEKLPEEEPKKRGRKKKETVVSSTPDDGVAWVKTEEVPEKVSEKVPDEVVEEEPTVSAFEILPPDGKRGLDKRLGTLPTLDGLTTEFCEKNNLSPLLIANTVGKKGTHPFFKGSISYLWYLPEDRRRHYMAGALNWEEEYKSFSDLCDPDKERKEWEEHGVDMDFVSCLVTTDEHPIFTSEPKRVDEPEVIQKVKAAGGFGKIVECLGPSGESLVKFMARFGINQQLFVDLLTIVKNYKEKPNAVHIPF